MSEYGKIIILVIHAFVSSELSSVLPLEFEEVLLLGIENLSFLKTFLSLFSGKVKFLLPLKHWGITVPEHLAEKEADSEIQTSATRNETIMNEISLLPFTYVSREIE